ncbi:MAG: glucose 1-dehydrogenase [Bryobacterales bacterium]|nr:glucose 1-dehydrogenase [Bryobacterales bacterium]
MSRLEGKVAVVTGASLGIGAAIASRLAAEGAAVVVNYGRSKDAAAAVVERIQGNGGRAIAVQADVSRQDQVVALFDQAQSAFGPLNLLVNNAGVYVGSPIGDITEEHIDKHFDLNVKGLLFATREAVQRFPEAGGSIINISSVVATLPPSGMAVYSATKGAVDTISRALAVELGARKIRVNSVSPGYVVTEGAKDMDGEGQFASYMASVTPLGRVGLPEDIADVVAFVASDDARWITGQVIPVSGGVRF